MKTSLAIERINASLRFLIAFTCIWIFVHSAWAQEGTVETITYYSTTQDDSCRMNVYCPPGYYDLADTNHYPVFYLVHGGGEDYTYWENYGRADTVLNYYISTGEAVPMILVMPDGRNLPPAIFSNEMLNDIIPYIELNFRVKTDKDSRGIGGLSWGGSQSLKIGIPHYEMFGYMAILSSGYFSQDDFTEAEDFLALHATDVEKSLRYFYFAQGSEYDITYESGMLALQMFRDNGLTVHYWEYSGGHQWSVWRQDFKSFTPYLFRDTTTRYISLVFQGGVIKNSTVMTYRDSLATAPADPTRTGHTFAGWYREPEYINSWNFATDTVRANMTLYADWSINSYKVSFNSLGGDYTPDTVIATYGSKIEEPAEPQKSGFVFGGWFKDDTYTQQWIFESSRVTEDITLYAKWIDPTAIKNIQESAIALFPNPANSYVQIENLPSVASIEIFSIEGNLLLHKTCDRSSEMIDISSLPAGLYYIVINTGTQNLQSRLIKQ
jgi:uncharacterized repeat protein (TIGR02543 family)